MSKETIDVIQLRKFLGNHEIPSVKQLPKTFLEIARQPHYENVISNIYAFYFDPHEEHGLGHLFINAFINCIKESLERERKDIASTEFLDDFQEFIIETEYGTAEKGRIDLFLYNDEQAIIIENKIYHYLANNLNDYWNTAKPKNRKDNVVGVLLTLGKHQGPIHSNFVNVLHLDFLKSVMASIGNHLMEASDKYVTFLKDLYQNTKNMSTKLLSPEDFKFYIENQDKILDAVKFNDQAKEHIKTQVVNAWDNQPKLKVKSATLNTKQFYSYRIIEKEGVEDLYFSTFFDDLMSSERGFWICIHIVEKGPYSDFFKHQDIKDILNDYPQLKMQKSEQIDDGWMYLAGREYYLDNVHFNNLQETVDEFITRDKYSELFDALDEKLKELGKSQS